MTTFLNRWLGVFAAVFLASTAQGSPANDDFRDAVSLDPVETMVTGSNVGATEEAGEPVHGRAGGGKTVWWIYEAQQNGFLTVSTLESVSTFNFEMDTVLAVYTGTSVSALTEIASNDDDPDSGSYGSKVIFPVQSGTRYYIAVDGWDYEEGAEEGFIVLRYAFSETFPWRKAPSWNLPNIQGEMVNSTNFSGKLTLVNFWATWCGPCVAEIPDLMQLQSEYERFGFSVIGISVDNATSPGQPPRELVRNFADGMGMNYPVVMTRPTWSGVENQFGDISAIPTTFLVDRNNNIVRTVVGSRNKAFFESMVKPYLFDNIGLSVRREDAETVIEWPSLNGVATVQLESVSGLAHSWTESAATVTDDGVTASARISNAGGGFFRLRINP
jgi:thiol-disulfide isomerase/thioredoxin